MINTNSYMSGALQHERQATLAAQAEHAHLVRAARSARRAQRREARVSDVWYARVNVFSGLAKRTRTDTATPRRTATVTVAVQQHA